MNNLFLIIGIPVAAVCFCSAAKVYHAERSESKALESFAACSQKLKQIEDDALISEGQKLLARKQNEETKKETDKKVDSILSRKVSDDCELAISFAIEEAKKL